jgi:hypothetical protein
MRRAEKHLASFLASLQKMADRQGEKAKKWLSFFEHSFGIPGAPEGERKADFL